MEGEAEKKKELGTDAVCRHLSGSSWSVRSLMSHEVLGVLFTRPALTLSPLPEQACRLSSVEITAQITCRDTTLRLLEAAVRTKAVAALLASSPALLRTLVRLLSTRVGLAEVPRLATNVLLTLSHHPVSHPTLIACERELVLAATRPQAGMSGPGSGADLLAQLVLQRLYLPSISMPLRRRKRMRTDGLEEMTLHAPSQEA